MRIDAVIWIGVALACAPLPASGAGRARELFGLAGLGRTDGRKHFELEMDAAWQLTPPRKERFDASGLAFHESKLLTINDRGSELYEIKFGTESSADLVPTHFFPRALVTAAYKGVQLRRDCEGIAVDARGNLYISEESRRAVFRSSPDGERVEFLDIDWSPVQKYFSIDRNASFEGIAVGANRLYLANERQSPRIIVVDLESLAVVDSFSVDSTGFAIGGPHYSDLAFHGGHLFVLDRNHRCILEVDPETKQVVAEFAFGRMELAEPVAYRTSYPTGAMEGLAVDDQYFWLVTDNNGNGRVKSPSDRRPTLFRCKRPADQGPREP